MEQTYAYFGKDAYVDLEDTTGYLKIVLNATTLSRYWRALFFIPLTVLFLSVPIMIANYVFIYIEDQPLMTRSVEFIGYASGAACLFGLVVLYKLWKTTKKCNWRILLNKTTGSLSVIQNKQNEWIGYRGQWVPVKRVVSGRALGGITNSQEVVVIKSLESGKITPVYSSLFPDYDKVLAVISSTYEDEILLERAGRPVSYTGIVYF